MARSSLIVALVAAFANLVSFANQLVLAHFFGAGAEMDGYLAGASLPLLISGLVTGILAYQLVPALTRAAETPGMEPEFSGSVFLGLIVVLSMIAVAGFAVGPRLVALLNPDLTGANLAAARAVARLTWLTLPCAVLSTYFTASLNVRHSFIIAAVASPIPMVGAMIGCIVGYASRGVVSISLGLLAGYLFLICVLGVRTGNLVGLWSAGWRAPKRAMVQAREAPWSAAALLIFVIYPFSDVFWGSRLGPSATSYLGYVQRLVVGIGGVTVAGATTVLFPHLARLSAQGEHAVFRANVSAGLRAMLVCLAPVAAIFAVLGLPVLQLLFQRGAFELRDSRAIAQLMPGMLCGLVAMSCAGLLFKALFAGGAVRVAGILSAGGAGLYFLLSGLLAHKVGLVGISIAYAVSWWLVLVAGLAFFRERPTAKKKAPGAGQFIARLAFHTLLAAGVAWLGTRWLPPPESAETLRRFLFTVGIAACSGLCYLVAGTTIFRLRELNVITEHFVALGRRT